MRFPSLLATATLILSPALLAQEDGDTQIAPEQMPVGAWEKRNLPAWQSPVSADAVKLDGTTEIRWQPQPFTFTAGDADRYIDFDGGNDAGPGTREEPWKHHPWDAEATGNAAAASGPATYVFKRGVIYRGALVADEPGTAEQAIRLTSDPAWGEGEAVLAGSAGGKGGWTKVSSGAAASAGFPESSRDKLWSVALPGDFVPHALWMIQEDEAPVRVLLARWPNWKAEHEYNIFTQWFRVKKVDKGFPRTDVYAPKVLNDPDPDAYKGATVWMDHANTSGEFSIIGPFPSDVGKYDPKTGRIQVALTHPARHPNANAPFFLENLPKFLDEAGEWYFAAKGSPARTLYARMPGDIDPNTVRVEVARHPVIIDIQGQQHIEVSGLTLTGGNSIDLNKAPRAGNYDRPDNYAMMAAIRLQNNAQHIRLSHLHIRDTAGTGIVNFVTEEKTVLRDIEITDSQFVNIDNEAIKLYHQSAPIKYPSGEITDIRILRNRIDEIGQRVSTEQGGRGIDLNGLTVGEIAGNVVNRTGGQGINVIGGRMGRHEPLIRILVDRNQVRDTLLQKQDFGGIEFWGVGPVYVFNNISINPVGWVAHRNVYHKNQAYYFDHGAKGYLFNNLGWSDKRKDAYRGIMGDYFFHEIRNRWNQAFHNSAINFRSAMTHSSTHGSQQQYLANLFVNVRSGVSHWRLSDAPDIAYANNLWAGDFVNVYDRWKGDQFATPEVYREFVAPLTNHLNKQFGWITDEMPIVDDKTFDFRLTDDSAAIDRGVKVFVPWSLYGTVGEWHFRHLSADPNRVLGYDVYPQSFHGHHDAFRMSGGVPLNDLTGSGFTDADYVAGPLEDWVRGAVRFDGKHSFALAHAALTQDFTVGKDDKKKEIKGADRRTVRLTDNNFAIEAVVKVDTNGTIAGKLAKDAGYALEVNKDGHVALRLRSQNQDAVQTSTATINDGEWHHVFAEVDRIGGTIRLFVDGEDATGTLEGTLPAAGVSLDNAADFVVGDKFVGALDYLRVARGTLADSETSIEELMSWQFNGPAQHDFVGRAPTGGVRDIGAVEHPTVSGRKPIKYTPRAQIAEEPAKQEASDEMKTGPDRIVKTLDWGAVSAPKQAKVGEDIVIQVVFGTETIEKAQKLVLDMHAMAGGKRITGYGRPNPVDITPGSTKPYTVTWKVKPHEGLSAVSVVIYASPDGTFARKTLVTEVTIPIAVKAP